LWSYLKEKFYKNNPHSLDELKENFQDSFLNVTRETLSKVASNMSKRWDTSTAERRGPL